MRYFHSTISFALIASLLFSCKKDTPPDGQTVNPATGAYVTNEGSFLNVNASVSYISSSGNVLVDPYFDKNNVPLGDVLQSLLLQSNRGFAVLNNSSRIEVFNSADFSNIATVEGLDYPRSIIAVSDQKAYITSGAIDGTVFILDMTTYALTGAVAVGMGPEKMTISGDHVFVTNSGGFSEDHTVSVINSSLDAVVTTIDVGDRPVDAITDALGRVWVLSAGAIEYDDNWVEIGHTAAMLHCIDPTDFSIIWSAELGVLGNHPDDLAVSSDGTKVYFNLDGVRELNANSPTLPGEMIIPGAFSSLDVHPSNGEIWTTSISNFVSNSSVYRYSSSGVLKGTFEAGIGSNGVYWK